MLSKTTIFHINALKPHSVEEANLLIEFLEYSVVFYVHKLGLLDLPGTREVYCNRKHVNLVRSQPNTGINNISSTHEYYLLNLAIETFIESLINNHYLSKVQSVTSQFNIECSLMNRANIVLSYEKY